MSHAKTDTIFVECDCSTHGFRVTSHIEKDWEHVVFLSFWVEEWYKDQGIFSNIWLRIKLAWKVLTKGDYFLHELVLPREKARSIGESIARVAKAEISQCDCSSSPSKQEEEINKVTGLLLEEVDCNKYQLLCPLCKYGYTHVTRVINYVRDKEDDPSYALYPGEAERDYEEGKNNPSQRRGAVRIHVGCELGCTFAIDLIQHKGNTILEYSHIRSSTEGTLLSTKPNTEEPTDPKLISSIEKKDC